MLVFLLDISQKQKNMLQYLNPSPLVIGFTFALMSGVLVHDMNIDTATKLAMTHPSSLASTSAGNAVNLDTFITRSDHTHVERASVGSYNSSVPKVPPRDDDRRYIQTKKQYMGGGDDRTYVWPSV